MYAIRSYYVIKDSVGGHIDDMLNERLLNILSTKENVNLATLGFEFEGIERNNFV